MLLLASQMARPPMYGFRWLPFTLPRKGSPFNFTSCTMPPFVISLIIYNPSQCILNFLGNLSNLLSYNNTISFTLKVGNLICRSLHAFSHYFCTCWWNPAKNRSSASSSSYLSLSSRAPWSVILVRAAMCRLGAMYSIGIMASTPQTSLKGVCPISFLHVIL